MCWQLEEPEDAFVLPSSRALKSQLLLKSPLDFKRALNNQEVYYGRYFILKRSPNALSHCRFGIIVSKKIGRAVTRNHIKRLTREAMRQQRLVGSVDMVLIAKRSAANADYHDITLDLFRILLRAGLI